MYGVSPGPKQTVLETILKIGKIVVPIILFVIGLFVMLREKTTKKVKIIVVSTLVILAIISIILINYLNSMIYSIY
jgi:predicted permease